MKTLSQVKPKADYTFDPRDVALKRPKVQTRIATAISVWAFIDSILPRVLGYAIKGDMRIAVEMYLSITSAPASRAAIKTAVRHGLLPQDAELFNALWTITSQLSGERDKLAHWNLGYSKDISDALLLSIQETFFAVRPTTSAWDD